MEKHCKKCGSKPKPLSREALACLMNYDWPGNVRELENVVERALVLGTSDDILPEDLPESLLEREPAPGMEEAKYHAAVKDLKKRLIQNAMEEARGNFTEAARLLGVHPNYLHRLIRNLEIRESLGNGGPPRPGNRRIRRGGQLSAHPNPPQSREQLRRWNRQAQQRRRIQIGSLPAHGDMEMRCRWRGR